MRQIHLILIFLINISCSQNNSKGEIHKETTMTQENKTVNINIPEEIINYIDTSVVFAIAEIGTWEGDFLGNSMHILYQDQKIKRILNDKLPEKNELFSNELTDFYTVNSTKYMDFINYLVNLSNDTTNKEYKTPDDLDVSGGTINFIYIKNNDSGIWLHFEPESTDLIVKIKEEFSKLFI